MRSDLSHHKHSKTADVCTILIRVDSGRRRQLLARSQALGLLVRGAFRSILAPL